MELGSSVKDKSTEQINTYDQVPYESNAFAQTHPQHLSTVATLFGMKPEPVKHCRVLELGCASGGNIIPMAFHLPESQFLGIDFSARQIDDGKKQLELLGLNNIELKQMDIMDVDESLGNFDYIVAHGVMTWVPEQVQEKIFKICQELLTPNGVAYISYNTLPGWCPGNVIRDMMLYHTAHLSEPKARIQESRAILNFLLEAVPGEDDAYGNMLRKQLQYVPQQDDFFLHEYLEGQNKPFLFYQFAERAAKHGLQYLSETFPNTVRKYNFSRNVEETLRSMSNEIVRQEQYMDLLSNRIFRCTLLCRQEVLLNRALGPESLNPFYVGCPVTPVPENMDFRSADEQALRVANGMEFRFRDPLLKAAFQHLSEIYPQTVKFADLLEFARGKFVPHLIEYRGSVEADAQILAEALLTAFAGNFIVLRTEPNPPVLSEHPTASALVRHQAKTQARVTNQLNETLPLDVFMRQLVQLLDGSRDRKQLVDALARLVQEGELALEVGGVTPRGQSLKDVLAKDMDLALTFLAKTAVLTG